MSSPSQRRGSCGHMMAGYDTHTFCARCRDKKKGKDPCVEKEGADCLHCNALTPEQGRGNPSLLPQLRNRLQTPLSVPPLWTRP